MDQYHFCINGTNYSVLVNEAYCPISTVPHPTPWSRRNGYHTRFFDTNLELRIMDSEPGIIVGQKSSGVSSVTVYGREFIISSPRIQRTYRPLSDDKKVDVCALLNLLTGEDPAIDFMLPKAAPAPVRD